MYFIAFRSNDDILYAEALPAPSEYQAFYPALSEVRKLTWRGRESAPLASYSRPLGHLGRYQRHPDRTSLTSESTQLSCRELTTFLRATLNRAQPHLSYLSCELQDLLHNLFFLFLGWASWGEGQGGTQDCSAQAGFLAQSLRNGFPRSRSAGNCAKPARAHLGLRCPP